MKKFNVTCPDCGSHFEPTETYHRLVQEEVDKELLKSREKILEGEKSLKERQKALDEQSANIESKVQAELASRMTQVQQTALKAAREKLSVELKDLQSQVKEKETALADSEATQLELRKQVREVEEKEKRIELEIQKRVQAETEKNQAFAVEVAQEEFRLKLLEKEKQIKDVQVQLEAAKRAAAQGSQQTQGEAIEEDFEAQLKARYPSDSIEPVPKGVEGADLIQRVRNSNGQVVGTLLIEVKNTKAYGSDWVPKLCRDQRNLAADACILITRCLPKDAPPISLIDGVFVVSFSLAVPFIATLRKSIEELSYARAVTHGQDEKMKLIYGYLTGPAFKQKITSIVQAFESMRDQHESEKKYFKKMWASREKMLEQVIDSAAGMYGDVEGIAGKVLPHMEALALPSPHEVPALAEVAAGGGDR